MEKKGVGINPISQIHFVDHLAVVCIIMGIPLIFTDHAQFELGQRYYPELDAQYVEYENFTQENLTAYFDVLVMSDLKDKYLFHEQYAALEKKYHKTLRQVHCPHGFSDKGFYLKKCANEDILLVYGQNMIDLFRHHEMFDKITNYVMSGNYRYSYFKQHRQFFDEIIQNEVLPRFAKKQPIILYAPTWKDLEESSTFFDAYAEIFDQLPDSYNMIVKLHPRLEEDDLPLYTHILGKYEGKSNLLFLKDFPLVYPLLAYTDIYLGDTSSVGYDFLPFDRPMFFLNKWRRNPKLDRGLYLFRCGIDIKPDAYPLIYRQIEASLVNDKERFSQIRAEVYEYTFGKERSFAEIKADIIKAYNKPLIL